LRAVVSALCAARLANGGRSLRDATAFVRVDTRAIGGTRRGPTRRARVRPRPPVQSFCPLDVWRTLRDDPCRRYRHHFTTTEERVRLAGSFWWSRKSRTATRTTVWWARYRRRRNERTTTRSNRQDREAAMAASEDPRDESTAFREERKRLSGDKRARRRGRARIRLDVHRVRLRVRHAGLHGVHRADARGIRKRPRRSHSVRRRAGSWSHTRAGGPRPHASITS